MASFRRCLGHVLLKAFVKEPNIQFAQCLRAINSPPEALYYSWSRYESIIVKEAKHTVLGCNLLSARIIHTLPSSCAPSSSSSEETSVTSPPPNQAVKYISDGPLYANQFNPALVEDLIKRMDGDMPVKEMPDPFEKEYRRCFLCKLNIIPDHKNIRLLSQFVSPYTGRIYGRAITGLCIPMQKHVAGLIKRAQRSGCMPIMLKDPKYLQDPQPYDAMSRRNSS